MKTLKYLILSILFLSSCDKFDWNNPYDPECPKELFTPSSPGATMEGNSVKLTWSQQNDDISGFALFRSAEGEAISNLTQTQKSTTQYIDASITPGKKYTYYVVAVAGTNKSDTVKAEIIPVIPVTISTGAFTELAATTVKVSGNITNAGGGTVASRGICWSTTPNPTVNSSKTTEGTGAGEFTSTLTNLLAGTTYYAKAYGENSRGISYGTEISFTTLGPPKLTTTSVSNITATTATSGGTIISDGGSPITAKGVVWSTSPSPTIDLSTKTNDGTGVGAFISTLSNLTNNTKYYIRAYATNIVGTSYGEEVSFTTSAPVPPILESLKQGLVAYYPFNGNANDESGNGNNGAVNGATLTQDRFGNVSKAYSFNGINNHINVPFSQSFNSIQSGLTMSAWILMEGGTGSATPPRVLELRGAYGGGGDAGFVMLAQSNSNISRTFEVRWHNNFGNTNISISPTNSISALSWHFISFTCDGVSATGKFYLDGVLINTNSSLPFQGVIRSCNYNNNPLIIGAEPNLLGMWGGKIDEVRIYNRALTQEEITYLANN